MVNDTMRNHAIFANQLLEDFISEITGSHVNRIIGKSPEEKFYVGKLSPVGTEDDNDFSSKTIIHQIGMDFIISKQDLLKAKLKIFIQGDIYYRVYPSFEEQMDYFINEMKLKTEKSIDNFDELFAQYRIKSFDTSVKVLPAYEKSTIQGNNNGLELKLVDIFDFDADYGYLRNSDKVNKEFHKLVETLEGDINQKENLYKAVIRDKVTIEDLINEDKWNCFIQKSIKNSTVTVGLNWNLNLICEIRSYGVDTYRVSLGLINESNWQGSENRDKNDKIRINTLFNSGIKVKLEDANYIPVMLNYFEDDYKYNRNQKAIGNNCTVLEDKTDEHLIYTTHLPVFFQYRLKTKDTLSVEFVKLIEEPVSTLQKIVNGMRKELEKWNEYFQKKLPELTKKGREKFLDEIKDFEYEIARYKNGVDLIRNYEEIRRAFILMNETFLRAPKNYGSWRLFQIVFIVSLIPDIASCEKGLLTEDELEKSKIENVDLLYFPTGGGKTEAFLGITVFNLFFDRIRGKKSGTTAMLKYPLRLLSIQQVQRVANILASAELIRREDSMANVGETFSLGYYVGDTNTPNKLTKETLDELNKKSQEILNEDYRVIDVCPFCEGKNINVRVDEEHLRLVHKCDSANCKSGGVLPFYIVDNEIYRYIPSVIISTVDKLAAIGYNSNFRNILGAATMQCPIHGYTSRKGCIEESCKIPIDQFVQVDLYDPAPSLLIQDELHLIRESLGAYDSHYETFMQYYITDLSPSRRKLKIIGATATISSFRQQIYHLYFKEPIRFPAESPYIDDNFYSKVDNSDLHRIILGFAPFGKAIINCVAYSMQYMKKVLWGYFQNPEKVLQIKGMTLSTIEEAKKLLENYWILLEYNNVKIDGNNVLNALDHPINTELEDEGIQPFDARKMTGDDTFQDVRKILAEVENTTDVFKGFNLIVATSMISHGVDADRFNIMYFFGVPGNTAEYIQAYSRAGRKYTGLIIMILRPTREKDQSYLRNFLKFHEYKDILVESVPINRWASKAIDKTLPGVVSGLLINYYDIELQYKCGNIYMMKNLQKAINDKLLSKEEVIKHLLRIYGCSNENVSYDIGNQYKEKIEKYIEYIFNEIPHEDYNSNERNYYISEGMEKLTGYGPMTSLRDTDKSLIVELV